MITQDRLRELFFYKNGNLIWKISKGKARAGCIAGSVDNKGYISIGIDGKYIGGHRAVFLYHYGYLPKIVDHIDGNPLNNNIDNLRAADFVKNGANSKKQKSHKNNRTTSKWKGVSKQVGDYKYCATITKNGKNYYLGRFECEDTAAMAYNEKAVELFGKFSSLNISSLNYD